MTLYICIILLLFILIIKYDIKEKDGSLKKWKIFLYIILVLVAGLSTRMGIDTMRYEKWYLTNLDTIDAISGSLFDTRWEPLFVLFCSILKTISSEWTFAHIIIAATINLSIFVFFNRYSKHFFTAILLYFIFFYYENNFESLRQSMAMSVILLSMPLYENRKWKQFYLCVVLSIGFHYSASAFLLLPLLRGLRFKPHLFIFGIVSSFVVGIFLDRYFGDVIRQIGLLTGTINYDYYLNSDYVINRLNIFGIISKTIVSILPIFLALIIRKDVKHDNFIIPLIFIYLVFLGLSSSVFILNRFVILFSPFYVMLLADSFGKSSHIVTDSNKRIISTFIALCLVYNAFILYNAEEEPGFKNIDKISPYTSIFNDENIGPRDAWLDSNLIF